MTIIRSRRPKVTIAQLCAAIDRGAISADEGQGYYSVKYGDIVKFASRLRERSLRQN